MRFQVLGPLRVKVGEQWSSIPARQQRVLLAVLLTEAGRIVSTGRLIDEIWGKQPPRGALRTLQGYVFRLRRTLGPECPLITREHGYELQANDDDIDAVIFERLVHSGRDSEPILSQALGLWRGDAFADVPTGPAVAAAAARLELIRLDAIEERLGALLALGRAADVVTEAQRVVELHPLRERLREHHMRALVQCGRRSEALEAYRQARLIMVAELGLEPGQRLRELQQQALQDDLIPAASTVPAQLPADVGGFTGRRADLQRLTNADSVVMVIHGTAGIGKTALAVRWGHMSRDLFPDGQLFVNLRGYSQGPALEPLDALVRCLFALGMTPERIPSDVDGAAGLLRTVLDGKRVLILLDNATHPDQVRPLIPGGPGCVVLVTSRDQLSGLVARNGATSVGLDVFTAQEALALLVRLLGPDRVQADRRAATRLTQLCGFLPLALRIAAANLAARPRLSLTGYAVEIAADRLGGLEVPSDPQAAIRPAFDQSYSMLPSACRRLFGLLGLHPGQDFTPSAAAALGDISQQETVRLLDQLARAHLIEEQAYRRYGLHDLLRLYAAEKAGRDEAAIARLHGFYLRTVDAAARQLYPEVLRLPMPEEIYASGLSFPDHVHALKWLDSERANLVALIRQGANWRLADAIRGYLYLGLHIVDWTVVAQAGLKAAQEDSHALAAMHISLAALAGVTDNSVRAIEHYTTAAGLCERAGWLHGQSAALGNLATIHRRQGRLKAASEHLMAALALDRRTGWRAGEATKLANLGLVALFLGRLDEAMSCSEEALALHQQSESRTGIARTLTTIGDIHRFCGRFDQAVVVLREALSRHRENGDRAAEGYTLHTLAGIYRDQGREAEAVDMAQDAVTIARDTGDRRMLADALTVLARGSEEVVEGYTHALALAREIGDRYTEADMLVKLAAAGCDGSYLDEGMAIAHANGYQLILEQARTLR